MLLHCQWEAAALHASQGQPAGRGRFEDGDDDDRDVYQCVLLRVSSRWHVCVVVVVVVVVMVCV